MKINITDLFGISFKGQRQDRNTVSQLTKDNSYDLNLPNQRRINEAIENLAKVRSEENIRFLLDTSNNLRYGTNINLGDKKSYNDWRNKLNAAAKSAIYASDENIRKKYLPLIEQSSEIHPYTDEEKAILAEREALLSKIDYEQLNKLESSNIRNINRNLDYFIISSEVPISQKLYILKRLNHLMSDEYEINSMLKDKKNQVLAEIINDIVINTPESEIPNSKEMNQLHHGMCAAISICRKNLAYEDKPNYVDMVMSELDNNDNLMIYDISKLGFHKKIPVSKPYIDFDTAIARGYRIVDTGSMYWMHVGDTIGANQEAYGFYSPIDSNYFDVFTDSHLLNDISEELADKHDYYRGLVKAKSIIGGYKASIEKEKFIKRKKASESNKNISISGANNQLFKSYIYELAGDSISEKQIKKIISDLHSFEVKNNKEFNKLPEEKQQFAFLHQEPLESKKEKIENYLISALPNTEKNKIKAKSEAITEILEDLTPAAERTSNPITQKMRDARALYECAAAYRAQQVLQLSIPEHRKTLMMRFHIPNKETKITNNIDLLINKIKDGTINPELQRKLAKNLETDNDAEALTETLQDIKTQIETITTTTIDKFYHSIGMIDRFHALAIEIETFKTQLDLPENKGLAEEIAEDLNLTPGKKEIKQFEKRRKALIKSKNATEEGKEDAEQIEKSGKTLIKSEDNTEEDIKTNPIKEKVKQYLQKRIDLLESGNCTQEEYIKIFNEMGFESQMTEFIDCYSKIGNSMFHENKENIIRKFNLLNGLPANATKEQTTQRYIELANSFDNMDMLIKQYEKALNIVADNKHTMLNSVDVRHDIIKKLENLGEIPTADALKSFRRRFNQIDKIMANKDNHIEGYADLPKAYTTFSPMEKAVLKKYKENINAWYAIVIRRLNTQYREIKEPLEEHVRKSGVKSGHYWVAQEGDSGLYSPQQVRIIEHMTDRPYHIEENGLKAIEQIRSGVYSGISSTSVDHTKPAMHAQYIADIAPVKFKNGETQYALFHDNTWGASEHENTWTDNNGLIRTDYARDFGGELGYITNDRYLNGNLQDNLLTKVGELKPELIENHAYNKLNRNSKDSFRFPLLADVVAAGVPPHIAYRAGNLKNDFLISPYQSIPTIEKYANSMTTEQIKKAMLRGDHAGENHDKVFDNFMEKIIGIKPFDKGISTLEDYKSLPENSPIKLMLDKIAVLYSYDNSTLYKEYSYVKNQDDINKIKQKVRKEALKDFYYVFAKDFDIRNNIAYSSNKEIATAIDEWVAKYGINVKPKELLTIITDIKNTKASDLDGSMIHAITLITAKARKDISEVTPSFENKEKRVDELTNEIREILIKNNYMTDIEELDMPNIEKWIDETFSPTTNEEFIKIFNRLRDMTTEDFNKLYKSQITQEALGIQNITGYDVLKGLQAENSKTINTLYNQIYRDEIFKDITSGDTKAHYEYNKFKREKSSTITYKTEKTFDDIYTDYRSSISLLELKKLFNKWKDENYKKYGVLPAYPKVAIRENENLESAMSGMFDRLDDYMTYIYSYNSQILSMEIHEELKDLLSKYRKSDKDLSYDDFSEILDMLTDFIEINNSDETLADLSQKIQKLIDNGEMSVRAYKNITDEIYKNIRAYETTAYGDTMEEAKAEALKNLKESKNDILIQLFDKQHRARAEAILNKWISTRIKLGYGNESKAEEADKYYNQFIKYYDTHSILDRPEKLFEEFLLLNAKDSERMLSTTSPERKKELDERNETLKEALKGMLVKANLVGLQMHVMSYKRDGELNAIADAFKKSLIELNDGSFIPVASPEGLSIMFSQMLNEDNAPILINFFNELGLGETFVESITDETQFNDAKNNIKRMHSILKSFDSQIKYINQELAKISDIDDNDNYKETLEEFRQKILAKTKRTNYARFGKLYSAAIDDILKRIEENPEMSRFLIVNSAMLSTIKGATGTIKGDLKILADDIKRLGEIERIIKGLQLPEGSKAKIEADKYLADCQDLIKFQEKFPTSYPESGLHIA